MLQLDVSEAVESLLRGALRHLERIPESDRGLCAKLILVWHSQGSRQVDVTKGVEDEKAIDDNMYTYV